MSQGNSEKKGHENRRSFAHDLRALKWHEREATKHDSDQPVFQALAKMKGGGNWIRWSGPRIGFWSLFATRSLAAVKTVIVKLRFPAFPFFPKGHISLPCWSILSSLFSLHFYGLGWEQKKRASGDGLDNSITCVTLPGLLEQHFFSPSDNTWLYMNSHKCWYDGNLLSQ